MANDGDPVPPVPPDDRAVVVPSRFRGPDASGHGGWVCGAVAGLVGSTAEVTLRSPPPLEQPLSIVRPHAEEVLLVDPRREGEAGQPSVVAEARPVALDGERLPDAVAPADAARAEAAWGGHRHHGFPTCFACGPDRPEGDGLRLFTGPVPGREGVVAARWRPHPSVADPTDRSGSVDERVVWAALDCPSAWPHLAGGTVVALLGRMAARQLAPVRVGAEYVVVGEARGEEGRKRFSVSALFDDEGRCVAHARATWIVIDQGRAGGR